MGLYNPNIEVTTRWIPLERLEFEAADRAVARVRDQTISDIVKSDETMIKSTSFFWGPEGEGMRTDPLASIVSFVSLTRHEAYVEYVDGVSPSTGVVTAADGVREVEVSLPAERAESLGLRVGDVYDAVPVPSRHGMIRARISGFFEPHDWLEEYWLGLGQVLFLPSPEAEEQELGATFLVQQNVLLDEIGAVTAGLPANYWWWTYTDKSELGELEVGQVLEMIDTLEQRLEESVNQADVISGLEPTMRVFRTRLLFARIPMFLIAALTMGVVAYYLFLVAGLLARTRQQDTLMLRSRGLSFLQVLRVHAGESIVLVAVASALAPFVALALVSQIGRLPVYEPATGGAPLSVEITWKAWAWGLGAGVASLVVMLFPVLASARRGVAAELAQQARPGRPPLLQRYYLDFAILALAALILWEVGSDQTVVSTGPAGERLIDPVLLFSPVIYFVGAALIFLRLFPLLTRLTSWLASHAWSLPAVLGMWRLGRSPYWYSWPALLIVMSSGLAVIAGTVASTLERSSEERIDYEVAGDVHIQQVATRGRFDTSTLNMIKALDGVSNVSRGIRRNATHGTTSNGVRLKVLGVEPTVFPKIAEFRDDFSELPLEDLLGHLEVKVRPDPIELPRGTTELGIWARTEPAVPNLFLWGVLRDSTGRSTTVTFGPTTDEWHYQSAAMPFMIEPVQIVSLQVFEQAGPDGGHPTVLFMDDLLAVSGQGDQQNIEVIVDFEDPGLWTELPTSEGLDTKFGLAGEPFGPELRTGAIGGRSVARVVMGRGTDSGIRGIYRTASPGPLPVLASPLFMGATLARKSEPFLISVSGAFAVVEIIGVVDYFPTLDPSTDPFLIIDVNVLSEFMELRGLVEFNANEAFIATDPAKHADTVELLVASFPTDQVTDRTALLTSASVDPLAVAGWRGMSVVAVIVTCAATTLGYSTYLSAHARRTRAEAAYLRSLGVSRSSYLTMVVIEHSLVGAIGVAIGIAAGLSVSGIAVESIAHTDTGRILLPPFILQTNWAAMAVILGAVLVAAVISLGAMLRAYANAPVHELVRTRE